MLSKTAEKNKENGIYMHAWPSFSCYKTEGRGKQEKKTQKKTQAVLVAGRSRESPEMFKKVDDGTPSC